MAWYIATRNDAILPVLNVYFLLMWFGIIIYMIRAMRQYGHWLRDNYADMEHKEVWQGFVVLAIILLVYAIYSLDAGELIYEYAMEVIIIVLVCYLLWRVETLSDLSIPVNDSKEETVITENVADNDNPLSIRNNIGSLLQQRCIDTQLYLQSDLNISQLAKAIGTNRYYLSQYFASQGTTYNDYINGLRINHFVSLYREAVDSKRSITAQQLAQESGYRSYNTFRNAFKRKTGQSATAWMKGMGEP
jgi:AraC-like DNA-binding protein